MTHRTALRNATALGVTLAMLAACYPSPPAPPPPPTPPPPAPAPPPPPPPEPQGDWRDIEVTPGTWVYRDDARGSVALFGEPNQEAAFVVRCDMSDRRIYFSREGSVAGGQGMMMFQASAGTRSYPAQNGTCGNNYVVAMTSASDDYLDTIAYSRGRIVVSVSGLRVLAIPNWGEMTRVFEDCRG
mgnify:CR=1 FL=1